MAVFWAEGLVSSLCCMKFLLFGMVDAWLAGFLAAYMHVEKLEFV
jgi:hypothetical protein